MAESTDTFTLTRDDLIAAFRLWVSEFRLEPESVDCALRRVSPSGKVDYAEACADQLIDFLIDAALEPLMDTP